MNLHDRYMSMDTAQRQKLAADVGVSAAYLYQMAVKFRGRRPSIDVMNKLSQADKKLKLTDLMAEFAESL